MTKAISSSSDHSGIPSDWLELQSEIFGSFALNDLANFCSCDENTDHVRFQSLAGSKKLDKEHDNNFQQFYVPGILETVFLRILTSFSDNLKTFYCVSLSSFYYTFSFFFFGVAIKTPPKLIICYSIFFLLHNSEF